MREFLIYSGLGCVALAVLLLMVLPIRFAVQPLNQHHDSYKRYELINQAIWMYILGFMIYGTASIGYMFLFYAPE